MSANQYKLNKYLHKYNQTKKQNYLDKVMFYLRGGAPCAENEYSITLNNQDICLSKCESKNNWRNIRNECIPCRRNAYGLDFNLKNKQCDLDIDNINLEKIIYQVIEPFLSFKKDDILRICYKKEMDIETIYYIEKNNISTPFYRIQFGLDPIIIDECLDINSLIPIPKIAFLKLIISPGAKIKCIARCLGIYNPQIYKP